MRHGRHEHDKKMRRGPSAPSGRDEEEEEEEESFDYDDNEDDACWFVLNQITD